MKPIQGKVKQTILLVAAVELERERVRQMQEVIIRVAGVISGDMTSARVL